MSGKIRIIGGQWRGRKLQVIDKKGLRPTPDRIRETLFNWLTAQIPNSHCLDLFAGSGALGIEAASRGAKQVLLIEQDYEIYQQLQNQIKQLTTDKIITKQTNALQLLKQSPTIPFDIVFLDPPFGQNLLPTCCQLLETRQWLNRSAYIYLESERLQTELILPQHWQIIRQTHAGQVISSLIKREI